MKHILLTLIFLSSLISFAQEEEDKTNGFFYKVSLATTLTTNKDYQIGRGDETGPFIEPNAFFLNNTFGYRFDERTTLGLNIGYNWHHEYGLHFIPAHLSMRYNVIQDDDNVFLRVGYGKFLDFGDDFEEGNFYKLGAGVELFDEDYKNSILLGLDFTRKRFGYQQLDKLSSVSIFLEYSIF